MIHNYFRNNLNDNICEDILKIKDFLVSKKNYLINIVFSNEFEFIKRMISNYIDLIK